MKRYGAVLDGQLLKAELSGDNAELGKSCNQLAVRHEDGTISLVLSNTDQQVDRVVEVTGLTGYGIAERYCICGAKESSERAWNKQEIDSSDEVYAQTISTAGGILVPRNGVVIVTLKPMN